MSSYSSNPDALKILVIDDEEQVRLVLEAILVLTGHRVGLATDGITGFARFQAEHWDVVLTDRHMPMVDGEALAGFLKARSPLTPVIMITGSPPAGGCANVDAIVSKPFTLASVNEAIRGCLAARRGVAPEHGVAAGQEQSAAEAA
jgi:CheY-like chemotaxis protein